MSPKSVMASAHSIVFRADASPTIGGGHVMRCLTLADALAAEGWACGFAVRSGTTETVPALARSRHAIFLLGNEEADEAANLRKRWPEGVAWLAVDHYGRDAAFESACRPWAQEILAIDELADRSHDCDLLLDQTLGRDPANYAGLVPERCQLLIGPRYALLRPEFAALRANALARRAKAAPPRRLLISLGASDPRDVTSQLLDAIALTELDMAVDVVLGAASPNLAAVGRKIGAMSQQTRLHVDTPDMASLMAEADLAVGAAGTSSWERCCLGLPSLVFVLADNQRLIGENLATAGAVRRLQPNGLSLAQSFTGGLQTLCGEAGALRHMSDRAASICDGRGAARTREALQA